MLTRNRRLHQAAKALRCHLIKLLRLDTAVTQRFGAEAEAEAFFGHQTALATQVAVVGVAV